MQIQISRIDTNGFYIEPVLVKDDDVITDADLIEEPISEGLHQPKWTGAAWVEGKAEADLLEVAKANKIAELNQKMPRSDNERICSYFICYGYKRI